MAAKIGKSSIDLGIVTADPDRMIPFYRDVLGLPLQGELPMPKGGRMFRFLCGTSVVKLVLNGKAPAARSHPGGIGGSTGLRYFTVTVENLEELVAKVREAGHKVVIEPVEFRPGIVIAMVEDPDGNWVEFLQAA